MRVATSRTSTTRPNVSARRSTALPFPRLAAHTLTPFTALKEDDPEGALKAFRAIVDDQSDKGEWYGLLSWIS